jgi:hypothetical protein
MESKKLEDLSKGRLIKADLYSRPNAMNGKYAAAGLGLDDLSNIKGATLGNLGIIIGVLGIIAWIVRVVFF